MNVNDALGTAALFAGLIMAIAPALQVRRMLQTRSSRDFSLGYPTLLCVGFVLWMAYGISMWNLPMMLSNAASLTFMIATIAVALYFRRDGGEGIRAAS
ncbi:MAG TPA: SemiSWEET family transporter [Candidatus Limnocylindrales bacterium]|nr:SemiSWEET family transporter [Candidatus Limnocylindrales bacterium]